MVCYIFNYNTIKNGCQTISEVHYQIQHSKCEVKDMQIILNNGGKTAEYECQFINTKIVCYPDGSIKYELGEDDMNSHFRCTAILEYQSKYGDVNCGLLDYYVFFSDNRAYLDVQNRTNSTFVRLNLSLTKSELNEIKSITRL